MHTHPALPAPIQRYLDTINQNNPAGFLASFAADAVARDIGHEYRGTLQIKEWSEREIFAVQVRLGVIRFFQNDDTFCVTVKVDGNFDKTGLPDPLMMRNDFTLTEERIATLTCSLAQGE